MRLMMNTKDWLAYYNTTAYPMLWSDRQPDPSGQATTTTNYDYANLTRIPVSVRSSHELPR